MTQVQDIALPTQPPALTPETAFALLQTWYQQKSELAPLKTAEVLNRKALAAFYFPEPEEGTNRHDIGWGKDLKLDYAFKYKVDEAMLGQAAIVAQMKKAKIPVDALFVMKPTLSLKEYRKLTDEQRAIVDGVITIEEPETPQLSIVDALQTGVPNFGQPSEPVTVATGKGGSFPQPEPDSDVPQWIMGPGATEGLDYEDYIASGWSHELMVENEVIVRNPAAPSYEDAVAAEAEEQGATYDGEVEWVMTESAEGDREWYHASGWTDELLIEHGLMVAQRKAPAAPPPPGKAAPKPPGKAAAAKKTASGKASTGNPRGRPPTKGK